MAKVTLLGSLAIVLAFDFDLGHDHRQHLFMYVNSRYPVRHKLPSGRGERAASSFNQGRRLSPLPSQGKTTPNYLLNDARSGSDGSTASTFPPLNRSCHSQPSLFCSTRNHFRKVSRAVRPVSALIFDPLSSSRLSSPKSK
jgi:hypothetical protein